MFHILFAINSWFNSSFQGDEAHPHHITDTPLRAADITDEAEVRATTTAEAEDGGTLRGDRGRDLQVKVAYGPFKSDHLVKAKRNPSMTSCPFFRLPRRIHGFIIKNPLKSDYLLKGLRRGGSAPRRPEDNGADLADKSKSLPPKDPKVETDQIWWICDQIWKDL